MTNRTHRTNYEIGASDKASPAFLSVQRAMESTQAAGAKLRNVLGSIGVGFSAGAFATAIVTEARQAEQASNRLQAVLRATGASASFAKDELDELADELARVTQFDDDSIRNAESALLKFGNVTGDVFREGLKLSADLAAFMGTEIPEAAQMIGRSLQSPTEGLSLMERQFGKLTEAEEKHIRSLVEQGRAIEAQNAVLDLWRQKVGGTAELMNTGLTKATRDVSKAWGDMLESFGRTDAVGRAVQLVLGDIASTLRDIEKIAKPSPLSGFERDLALIESELTRIERSRPKSRRSALVDEQVSELNARRDALQATLDAAKSTATDIHGFDPARLEVRLGGGRAEQALRAVEREAVFRAEKAVELEEMAATDSREAWAFYTKGRIEQEELIRKSREDGMRAWFETIDMEQAAAIEAGEEVLAASAARTRELESLAKDLGFTFSSGFEDAIVKGENLRVVLRGIAEDILRITVRRTATEPAAAALSAALAGLVGQAFGAGAGAEQLSGPPRADGGDVFPGVVYPVGERGPELFVPDRSGRIVPNHELGSSVNIYQTCNFHGDFRLAARAEIMSMLPQIADASASAVEDRQRRGRRV